MAMKTLSRIAALLLPTLMALRTAAALTAPSPSSSSTTTSMSSSTSFNVQVNEFFKKPVPQPIRDSLSATSTATSSSTTTKTEKDLDLLQLLTAPPSQPGVPRPLWLVILASVPTGLVWYGYYKFCVEEELMQHDLDRHKQPRGFGGYGTLGPFVYGALLGPMAAVLHLPGGLNWSSVGIVFIYYTQFLLYDRVNELYREEGLQEPLPLWWTLPVFFPFDLIVGLRQVHSLSQYWYRQRNAESATETETATPPPPPPPTDPVVTFFPFIGADRFTWQEFLTTPSLWCKLTESVEPIDRSTLPIPVQKILSL